MVATPSSRTLKAAKRAKRAIFLATFLIKKRYYCMMIGLLTTLGIAQYAKAKNLVIVLLLLAYGASCVVPRFVFAKKLVFTVQASQSLGFPLSIPISESQESSDTEDNFPQEDENVIVLSSISLSTTSDSWPFHVSNPPSPGSFNPPFSPPEIPA